MPVYLLDCSPLTDPDTLGAVLPYLDKKRQSRIHRQMHPLKKAQTAAAGLLLHEVFGDVSYRIGEHGKPYLAHGDTHFNITHSGQWVALATANCEIGLDMQTVAPLRPAVMRRCFTQEQRDWIGNDPLRFARLWTVKEAYIKMTGTGLSVPARDVPVTIPLRDGLDSAANCYWQFFTCPDDTPITLCNTIAQPTELIVYTNIKDLL